MHVPARATDPVTLATTAKDSVDSDQAAREVRGALEQVRGHIDVFVTLTVRTYGDVDLVRIACTVSDL